MVCCLPSQTDGSVDQSAGMLSEDVKDKGYCLLCVAMPQSDCSIEVIEEVFWGCIQLCFALCVLACGARILGIDQHSGISHAHNYWPSIVHHVHVQEELLNEVMVG